MAKVILMRVIKNRRSFLCGVKGRSDNRFSRFFEAVDFQEAARLRRIAVVSQKKGGDCPVIFDAISIRLGGDQHMSDHIVETFRGENIKDGRDTPAGNACL